MLEKARWRNYIKNIPNLVIVRAFLSYNSFLKKMWGKKKS
jgi:hypothetical protein